MPLNIDRLVRQNQKYSNAEEYSKHVTVGTIVSRWHEERAKQTVLTFKTSSSNAKYSSTPTDSGIAMCAQQGVNNAVCMARKARLLELYELEALQHQAELREMGLSLQLQTD